MTGVQTCALPIFNALAGYVTRVDGERLVFAIVVNNHTAAGSEAVAAIDAIGAALAGN